MKGIDQKTGRKHSDDHWYGPWLPTASAAKKAGSKHFFSGEPCKRGHITLRLASNGSCMECHRIRCNEYNKQKRQSDEEWRERTNQKKREKYDPDKNRQWNKAWREANIDYWRDYQREYQRRRRAEKPEVKAAERRKMSERRSDPRYVARERERERARYAANPDKYREKTRRYFKENPEVAATQARNRRARLRSAPGFHTPEDVSAILERQKYKCVYCGKNIRESYEVDHIIAISKGGSNWPDNLQCLCKTCNCQKNNLDPITFAQRKGRLL